MLLVAPDRESRVRRSGRTLAVFCVGAFLSINLANPILVAHCDAAAWASSEFEQQAGRLPYLPRQSWSPSADELAEAALRKTEPPRFKTPPASVPELAASPSADRFHPGKYPPLLEPLTRPAYLHPDLDGAPVSWRPPPL